LNNTEKADKWLNALLLDLKVMKGKEMKETSYERTYESSNSLITLSYAPGDEYNINANDIATAKKAGSKYFVIMSPYTPVTHEEMVGFELSNLIEFFKKNDEYSKMRRKGEMFLQISYDNVCDLALFMRTLR